MFYLLIGVLIAYGIIYYFFQKGKQRNEAEHEQRKEDYNEWLQKLRKNKEQNAQECDATDDQ